MRAIAIVATAQPYFIAVMDLCFTTMNVVAIAATDTTICNSRVNLLLVLLTTDCPTGLAEQPQPLNPQTQTVYNCVKAWCGCVPDGISLVIDACILYTC